MCKRLEIISRIEQIDKKATLIQRNNPREASKLWQEARKLAIEIDHFDWMARSQQGLGTCAYYMADEKQALERWKEAIQTGRAHGEYRVTAMSYVNIGSLHSLRGRNHSAMKSYIEANRMKDQLDEESKDYMHVDHLIRTNMATVHNRLGEYKEAIACLRPLTEAKKIYAKSEVEYYINWGIAHAAEGDEETALAAYKQAIEIAKEKNHIPELGNAYKHLARLHLSAERFSKAEQYYHQALDQFRSQKLELVQDEIGTLLALAHMALNMDALEMVEKYLDMIDLTLLEKAYPEERVSYYHALKELHKNRDEMRQALHASEAYAEAILALDHLQNQRQAADMRTNLEFELLEQERKQTAREKRKLATLNEQKDLLLQKMDLILRVFDHDLRGIIAGPTLIVSVMENKLHDLQNEINHEDIDYLAEKVEDMIGFTDELEDIVNLLAHIREYENKKHQIQMKSVSVSHIIEKCVSKQERKAKAKAIQIKQQSVSQTWYVTADQILLERVLYNLVTNAIKYTPKNDDRTITIKVKQREDAIDISVCDEGQGLTAEDKSKLFSIGRLSAQPTDGEATTGLGLYLTRQLTRMMRGEITAESPGRHQGSVFTVTLPQVKKQRNIGA